MLKFIRNIQFYNKYEYRILNKNKNPTFYANYHIFSKFRTPYENFNNYNQKSKLVKFNIKKFIKNNKDQKLKNNLEEFDNNESSKKTEKQNINLNNKFSNSTPINKINNKKGNEIYDTNSDYNQNSYSKIPIDSIKNLENFPIKEDSDISQEIVTPWEVKGKVDYMKLVIKFGTELIDEDLISKFEKLTNKPIHPWIKRKIFFTHRGLNTIINALENNEKVFLYTGRGPSSESMHLGHLIPFIFTKWLQETLNCILVIQISDEEKFAFKKRDFDEIYRLGKNNSKEIIAIGFEPNKTFIFSNRDYRLKCSQYEILTSQLKIHTNANEIKKIFGFTDEASIAMMDWPLYQTAASYYQAYPNIFKGKPTYCLVPHAIDQDPYFRLARDLSAKVEKYKLIKPCNIMSKFVPPLTGDSGKMSSSVSSESTIFLNDSPNDIRKKIFEYSYSGGGGNGTLQEHRKYGGNCDKDMAFQYLNYFEYDDEKLEKIRSGFSKGIISCREIKEILSQKIIEIISTIQENKQKITDEYVALFYNDNNKLENNDNLQIKYKYSNESIIINNLIQNKKLTEKQIQMLSNLRNIGIDDYEIKYHDHLSIKENEINLKNTIKGTLTKTLFLKGNGNNYFLSIIDYDEMIDLKSLRKILKLQTLKFGENDTINHLFEVKKSEFGFISILNLKEIKDRNFTILISEKLKDSEFLSSPFLSEESHITIKKGDIEKIIKLNKFKFLNI